MGRRGSHAIVFCIILCRAPKLHLVIAPEACRQVALKEPAAVRSTSTQQSVLLADQEESLRSSHPQLSSSPSEVKARLW